ncbi:hypothetical protein CYMTET_33846, partial [Cymbomonas tetramitiformis]
GLMALDVASESNTEQGALIYDLFMEAGVATDVDDIGYDAKAMQQEKEEEQAEASVIAAEAERHDPEQDELLHRAVQTNNVEEVRRLVAGGAIDVNNLQPGTGNTALHFAAAKGLVAVVAALLEHPRIAPDTENKHSTTALSLSSTNGHLEVMALLLAHPHCDPNYEAHYEVR